MDLDPNRIKFALWTLLWLQVKVSMSMGDSPEWSLWSVWSKCPSECGPAVSVRSRLCKGDVTGHKTPSTSCPGRSTQHRLCEENACSSSEPSARQKACSKYDHRVFSGRQYVWEPFVHSSDPCKLSCRAKDAHFYANLAERVQDGVECGRGGRLAVCISGVCQPVGCDKVVLSNATRDACGHCQGEGTTCKTISGIFTSTQLTRGLNHVLSIPSGSTSLNITELMPSKNLLVLQTVTGQTFINADENDPTPEQVKAAGTVFKHSAKTSINPRESIVADGPTNVTLILKVLSKGSNPGIIYTFSVPRNVSDSYIKQITSHSTKPLSVAKAPVYLEDNDTPRSIPHTHDVTDEIEEQTTSPADEIDDDVIVEQNNDEKNAGTTTPSHSTAVKKSTSEAPEPIPNAIPANDLMEEDSQSTSSPPEDEEEAIEPEHISDQQNNIDLGQVIDFNDEIDEDSGEDDENALKDAYESEEDLDVDVDMSRNNDEENVIDEEEESELPEAVGNVAILGAVNESRSLNSESGSLREDSLSSGSRAMKSHTMGNTDGDESLSDRKTHRATTASPTIRIRSDSRSKGFKIPRYSSNFLFGEKYKKLADHRRGRRRHSRRRGHNSGMHDGNEDTTGRLSQRQYPKAKQSPQYVRNDDNDRVINGHQQLYGPIRKQRPHRYRPEPREELTSALESRPVTVRRYHRRNQNRRTDRTSREDSLRDRQARIEERRRRLREQREEYNRRLREHHEKQLQRRRQRAQKHSNPSSSQQRYTRVELRTRSQPAKTSQDRSSRMETTTAVIVPPSTSRFDRYSVLRRGSTGIRLSRHQDVSRERYNPVKVQPKPRRVISRVATNSREELVSGASASGVFTETSADKDGQSFEKNIQSTDRNKVLPTPKSQVEMTTKKSDSKEESVYDNLIGYNGTVYSTSSQGRQDGSSTNVNTRRVISRVRPSQPDQSQSFPNPQPAVPHLQESVLSSHVIPATKTNNGNDIIPNSRLTAEQLPPKLISESQLTSDKTNGYTSYKWRISGLTECTHSCGGGVQQTVIVCVSDRTQAVVTDENCALVQKPEIKAVTCNKRPCPAKWVPSHWSSCSATCGEGQRTRTLVCQTRVSPTLNLTMPVTTCEHLEKPEETQSCKLKACNSWTVGNWSECSAQCGDGARMRSVQCVDLDQQPVEDEQCPDLKPKDEEECNLGSCGKGWFVTQWPKECPVECGTGELTRKVFCASDDGEALPESRCDSDKRPKTKKPCRVKIPCGGSWFAGEWSKCNTTCGQGSRSRDVLCIKKVTGKVFAVVDKDNCQAETKPIGLEPCSKPNCRPEWYMTSWAECSKSCETGYRTRELKCLSTKQELSDKCPSEERPRTREPCNTQSCENSSSPNDLSSGSDSSCRDTFAQCRVVKRARLCRYGYYSKMCCKSCSDQS